MERLSLAQIVAHAPEVWTILREAKEESHQCGSLDEKYSRYKGLLGRWVGWYSPVEELRDSAAYETVIKALRKALDY